jgi:L-rhamnose isomerase
MKKEKVLQAYDDARKQYAALGVDTDEALRRLDSIRISLHCWQTDDVGGFETPDAILSGGGIQATGNYPGKARTISQMRQDLEKVMSLLPGQQRLSLHAIYGEFGGSKADRDSLTTEHFRAGQTGRRARGSAWTSIPFFSHPMAGRWFHPGGQE